MPTFGIRVAVNGSETDTTVENDSAQWVTKIGRVKITGGGGSWWKRSTPWVCDFELNVPLDLAPLVRTVTVAVDGPGTSQPWLTLEGGKYYRIVFHGDVTSVRATLDAPPRFQAVDEMNGLLNRKARTAAAPNTGADDLLTAIETAHSLTLAGNTEFPTSTDFNLDRPVQKSTSNGEWVATALAGTGVNMSAEWTGTLTAPVLKWRADYYYPGVNTAYRNGIMVGRPYDFVYGDIGCAWQDFVARVNIDGEGSAGTQYYGWARLADTAARVALGGREVNMTTWIDSAAQCEAAAVELLSHTGEAGWYRMYRLGLQPDIALQAAKDDPNSSIADGVWEIDYHGFATMMLGDVMYPRDPFDNTDGLGGNNAFGLWPPNAPYGSARYDALDSVWNVTVTDDAASYTNTTFVVRTITREWIPAGGWYLEYGLDPLGGVGITSSSSGTY